MMNQENYFLIHHSSFILIYYTRCIMTLELFLPTSDRRLELYRLNRPGDFPPPDGPLRSRIPYAAVHVVADPLADHNPTLEACRDGEATLAYRHYLWSLGLSVAEAMDTAQRGMGLPGPVTQEWIRRSVAEARAVGGNIACGAGTDQLAPRPG